MLIIKILEKFTLNAGLSSVVGLEPLLPSFDLQEPAKDGFPPEKKAPGSNLRKLAVVAQKGIINIWDGAGTSTEVMRLVQGDLVQYLINKFLFSQFNFS